MTEQTKVALAKAGFEERDGDWYDADEERRLMECGVNAKGEPVYLMRLFRVTEEQIPRILAALSTPTPAADIRAIARRINERAAALTQKRVDDASCGHWYMVDRNDLWDAVEQELAALVTPTPAALTEEERAAIEEAIEGARGDVAFAKLVSGLEDTQQRLAKQIDTLRNLLTRSAPTTPPDDAYVYAPKSTPTPIKLQIRKVEKGIPFYDMSEFTTPQDTPALAIAQRWLENIENPTGAPLEIHHAEVAEIVQALSQGAPTTDTLMEAQLAMVREAVERLIWEVDPNPYEENVKARADRLIANLRNQGNQEGDK